MIRVIYYIGCGVKYHNPHFYNKLPIFAMVNEVYTTIKDNNTTSPTRNGISVIITYQEEAKIETLFQKIKKMLSW